MMIFGLEDFDGCGRFALLQLCVRDERLHVHVRQHLEHVTASHPAVLLVLNVQLVLNSAGSSEC